MRTRVVVFSISILAFVGVSGGRAQSSGTPVPDAILHPWHQAPAAQQQAPVKTPETIPDWAPPGTELPGKNGVTRPKVLHEAKPSYTQDAMKAKVQGKVVLQCIVEKDGSVGEVRVVDSLDKVHGLDDEAVKAMKKWRFGPATKDGVPVPVVLSIEMTFTLR